MRIIELKSSRPSNGEIKQDNLLLYFTDADATYKDTTDEGLDHNVLIKNMVLNLPADYCEKRDFKNHNTEEDYKRHYNYQGTLEKFVVNKNNPSSKYYFTLSGNALSDEQLNQIKNSKLPVKELYSLMPESEDKYSLEDELEEYYNEEIKDDYDEFDLEADLEADKDLLGDEYRDPNQAADDTLEAIAKRFGRDSNEYIDAASKQELANDGRHEARRSKAIDAAIYDEDLNNQFLQQLVNEEEVYINDVCILSLKEPNLGEVEGQLGDEGLDYIEDTCSFYLIQQEDGTWGLGNRNQDIDTDAEVADLEIVGLEEQFNDDDDIDYEDIYNSDSDYDEFTNYEESKTDIFNKIKENAKLRG